MSIDYRSSIAARRLRTDAIFWEKHRKECLDHHEEIRWFVYYL